MNHLSSLITHVNVKCYKEAIYFISFLIVLEQHYIINIFHKINQRALIMLILTYDLSV